MALIRSESSTSEFFKKIGFTVENIPKASLERRADFRLFDERDSYILEVKSKDDDEEYKEDLRNGKIATRQEYVGRTPTITRQIRDGLDRIRKTPKNTAEFGVLALVAADDASEWQVEQFEGALYGISNIICEKYGKHVGVPCYYYTFNELFNVLDIEGIVIFWQQYARLCINNFSRRTEQFRTTKLYQFFLDHDALKDPLEMEKQGLAFIADCDLNRKEPKLVEKYIKNKYNIQHRIIAVNFTYHSAGMFVPDEAE